MDEEVAAFIHKIAPREKPGEWNQKGLKRVLTDWRMSRPDDFETIRETDGFSMVVGFNILPRSLGQYGYDTGLHFEPDFDDHLLEEDESKELVEPFYLDWVEAIQGVIREEQERTLFSPKEFATFFAHRNPKQNERKTADALGIKVGTYRGKVGRVKSKLETARDTLQLANSCPKKDDYKNWKRNTFEAPFSVIHRVDEDRLPVNAASRVAIEGLTIDDLSVETLIRD